MEGVCLMPSVPSFPSSRHLVNPARPPRRSIQANWFRRRGPCVCRPGCERYSTNQLLYVVFHIYFIGTAVIYRQFIT